MHHYLWVFTFIFGCFYSVYVKLELQKHQFADVLQIRCSRSFRNIQPKPCNFIKKRLQHICFPVNIANILRVVFLQITSGGRFGNFSYFIFLIFRLMEHFFLQIQIALSLSDTQPQQPFLKNKDNRQSRRYGPDLKDLLMSVFITQDHLFSLHAKFSEKPTFFTP